MQGHHQPVQVLGWLHNGVLEAGSLWSGAPRVLALPAWPRGCPGQRPRGARSAPPRLPVPMASLRGLWRAWVGVAWLGRTQQWAALAGDHAGRAAATDAAHPLASRSLPQRELSVR